MKNSLFNDIAICAKTGLVPCIRGGKMKENIRVPRFRIQAQINFGFFSIPVWKVVVYLAMFSNFTGEGSFIRLNLKDRAFFQDFRPFDVARHRPVAVR